MSGEKVSTDKDIAVQTQKSLGIPTRNLQPGILMNNFDKIKLAQIYELTNAKYVFVSPSIPGIGGSEVQRVTRRLTQIFTDGTTNMEQKMEILNREVLEMFSYAAKNLEPYFTMTAEPYNKWLASYYPEMAEAIPDEHVHKAISRIHSFTKQTFGGTDMFFDESINCTKDDFTTAEGQEMIAMRLFMLFASFEMRRRLVIFEALRNNVNLLGIPKDNVPIFNVAHRPGDLIANMRGLFWATQKTTSGFKTIEANLHRMLQEVGGLSAIVTSTTLKKIVNSFDPLLRNAVEGTIETSVAAVTETGNSKNAGRIGRYPAITSPTGSEKHDPLYDNLMRSAVLTCEYATQYMNWFKTMPVEKFNKQLMNIEIPSYESKLQLWQQIPQSDFIEHMFEFMTKTGDVNEELIKKMIDDASKDNTGKSKFTKIDCNKYPQSLSTFIRKKHDLEIYYDDLKNNNPSVLTKSISKMSKLEEKEQKILEIFDPISSNEASNFLKALSKNKHRKASFYTCCKVLGELENYPIDMFEAGYKTFINAFKSRCSKSDLDEFDKQLQGADTFGDVKPTSKNEQKFIRKIRSIIPLNDEQLKRCLMVSNFMKLELRAEGQKGEVAKKEEDDVLVTKDNLFHLCNEGGKMNIQFHSSELQAKIEYVIYREMNFSLELVLAIFYALIPLNKNVLKNLCEKDVFIPIGGAVVRQRGDMNEHMIGLANQKIGVVNMQDSENFRIFAVIHKDVHIQSTVSMLVALFHKAAIAYQPFVAGVEYIGGAGHGFINDGLLPKVNSDDVDPMNTTAFTARMKKFLNTKELGNNCLIPISASPRFLASREKPDAFEMRGRPRAVDFFNLSNPESPVFSANEVHVPEISGLEFFWYCITPSLTERQKTIIDIDHDKVLPDYMKTTFADTLIMYQTSFAFMACHMNQRYMSEEGLRNNSNMNDNEYGYLETISKTLLGPYYEGSKDVQCGATPFPVEILNPQVDMRD